MTRPQWKKFLRKLWQISKNFLATPNSTMVKRSISKKLNMVCCEVTSWQGCKVFPSYLEAPCMYEKRHLACETRAKGCTVLRLRHRKTILNGGQSSKFCWGSMWCCEIILCFFKKSWRRNFSGSCFKDKWNFVWHTMVEIARLYGNRFPPRFAGSFCWRYGGIYRSSPINTVGNIL